MAKRSNITSIYNINLIIWRILLSYRRNYSIDWYAMWITIKRPHSREGVLQFALNRSRQQRFPLATHQEMLLIVLNINKIAIQLKQLTFRNSKSIVPARIRCPSWLLFTYVGRLFLNHTTYLFEITAIMIGLTTMWARITEFDCQNWYCSSFQFCRLNPNK